MVGDGQMHGLMRDHVPENKVRCKNQPPTKREVSPGGAIAPLGALVHHVDAPGTLSKARSDNGEVPLNLRSRVLSQPFLEAARRRAL